LLARSLVRSSPFSYSHISSLSRNFDRTSLSFRAQVSALRPRLRFVSFASSCATLNSDFLAIHACRHYDIWRRGSPSERGFARFRNCARHGRERQPESAVMRPAARQRDLLKRQRTKRFFKLLSTCVLPASFFFLPGNGEWACRNRERDRVSFFLPLRGIFIAPLLYHRTVFSRPDRITVRLSYAARYSGFLSS